MGYPFETVADGVCVVVERIDAPLVAHVGMRVVLDTIDHGVSESGIDVFLVDFGTKRHRPFLMQSQPHLVEQLQVLFDRPVSILGGESVRSLLPHLLGRLVADERVSLLDELESEVIEDFKVVGGMCDFPGLVAHELDVFFDVDDVLDVLLGGVGIIEAQVALPTLVDLGLHEVEPHRLAVPDV